jgi:hypothetical protein
MNNRTKAATGWIGTPLIAFSLAAGNGAGSSVADATSVIQSGNLPPPPQSAGPAITGTPPSTAAVRQPFSFKPSVAAATAGAKQTFAVVNKPLWASFDSTSGHLSGMPQATDLGSVKQIAISVRDGARAQALEHFAVTAVTAHKSNYGHYFATNYSDSPADAAMLCEQQGVNGIVWRRTWREIEPSAGDYDFSSFGKVLAAIAASRNPKCQMWLLIEFKSFANSAVKNPCPVYLQARHSAPNVLGHGAVTCFMWEPSVVRAYVAMLQAAAARYDSNPRVEGLILQESSLSLNGSYSQDVADGGTYTPTAWRDALIALIDRCAAAFTSSRCIAFLNFVRGGQSYLHDISAAISAIPNDQACISGPDLLPSNPSLYRGNNSVYQVIARHAGCRSNSAQNDSYQVPGCALACIFNFAVSGTLGTFPASAPLTGGLCVNSYIFWNHRATTSATGLDWRSALPVIASHPYGRGWNGQCVGTTGPP